MLEDLQEAANFILNTCPGLWLVNWSVVINIGHVLHRVAPQGHLHGNSWVLAVRVARTKKFLKLFRRQKAPNRGSENASCSRSVWRVGRWRLVIDLKFGWYLTTSGVQAVLSWFKCCCKQFSLETASAWWIFVFSCCSRYPQFNRCF